MQFVAEFEFKRETTNKFRYDEVAASEKDEKVGALYVVKAAMGEKPAQHVTVTVAWEPQPPVVAQP